MLMIAKESRLPSLALLAALCGAVVPARGADAPSWPRFHGPKGDNLSTETNLLKTWLGEGPELLWTAKGLGEGYATVAIAQGAIYTDGNIADKTVITALDLEGKPKWTAPLGEAWTAKKPGTRGTPTIEAGCLYLETGMGELGCFDAATGKAIWRLNILERFAAPNINWGLSESPVIDGNNLLCTPGGPRTAVVALDKKSGQTVWQSPTANGDAAGYCTPAVISFQGLRIVLTLTAKALIGVNADNGDLLFRHEHITSWDVNVLTPIFHDGCIFLSSGYGSGSELLKLTVDGKKASVQRQWQSKDLDNHHGGVLLWDGYLYGSCTPPKWTCLDWKTGKTMYVDKRMGKGSLTYADGMLYLLSETSEVGLAPVSSQQLEVVSRFKLPEGGEGPSWAHPVVCGGRLYIRHGDFLYCYRVQPKP